MARPKDDPEDTLIADNRKAFHDYHILETFEAGIALLGTERVLQHHRRCRSGPAGPAPVRRTLR